MENFNRDLNKDFLKELECAACMELMLPPIHSCEYGHNICSTCKPTRTVCPSCRGPFVNIRNLALERMARNVKQRCTSRAFGCSEMCYLNFMTDHKAACAYAPYTCPFANEKSCDWGDLYRNLKEHLLEKHSDYVTQQNDATDLVMETGIRGLQERKFVFAYDEIFYTYIYILQNNCCYFSVRYIGAPENASKYGYKICFSKSNSIENIVVSQVTSSIAEDIFAPGKGIMLPCDLLKRFEISDKLSYTLQIFEVLAVNAACVSVGSLST